MSEIRLLTSSDEHLADLSPGLRKDDYKSAILRKIEWQGQFARRFSADAILRGGDFFHLKAANKTTHSTVALASELHRKFSCPTYAIAGNHDMVYNDPSTIARQPLGVMFKSEVFKPMSDAVFQSGSLKVRVIGVEYTTDLDVEGLHDLVRKRDDDVYTIAFVHALAAMAPAEKIQSFFNERIFDYRDLVFKGCPDAYVFGHYHKDQGIVDHMGVKFVNLGAISRGALTFENLERIPKISSIVCNSQGISIEEQIVPHADASEIFDLELKNKRDQERKSLDEFIHKLKQDGGLAADSSLETRKSSLNSYPDDLKRLALQILESAAAGTLEE